MRKKIKEEKCQDVDVRLLEIGFIVGVKMMTMSKTWVSL